MDISSTVGARIRKIRQDQGMTAEALAAAAGLPRSAIFGLETGQRKVALDDLPPLAAALNVQISDLLPAEWVPAQPQPDALSIALRPYVMSVLNEELEQRVQTILKESLRIWFTPDSR